MPSNPYDLIGELVLNKYGSVGMIVDYNHVLDVYKIEWYGGNTPYTVEHQKHKVEEYISNYDLYEKTKIYRR